MGLRCSVLFLEIWRGGGDGEVVKMGSESRALTNVD
jgi:hypothetical protein